MNEIIISDDYILKIRDHKQFGHQEDGLRLWEAGVVLARYIHFNLEKSDKFYVDLGTGVGLAGIVLSQKCGRILLTDNNE